MPEIKQPLGNSIIRAAGLRDSMLPASVVNAIALQLNRSYYIKVGASSIGEQPCGNSEENESNACCRIILNPGPDPWPTPSPFVTQGPTSEISFGVNIKDVANLKVSISLKIVTRITNAEIIKGACPESCTDETLKVGINITYMIGIKMTGRLEKAKTSVGGLLGSVVPDIVNFGPSIGDVDVSNDLIFSGATYIPHLKS